MLVRKNGYLLRFFTVKIKVMRFYKGLFLILAIGMLTSFATKVGAKEENEFFTSKQKRAEAGDVEAMYYMAGHSYSHLKDFDKFMYWGSKASEQGHALAKFMLATVLLKDKADKVQGCKFVEELLSNKYDPKFAAPYENSPMKSQVLDLKKQYCTQQ